MASGISATVACWALLRRASGLSAVSATLDIAVWVARCLSEHRGAGHQRKGQRAKRRYENSAGLHKSD
jgi:hypothetical protein